jgi:hypothetical protein
MDRVELGRLLGLVAHDLDERGYPSAGIVRQAAVALLEDAMRQPSPQSLCPIDGLPVTQPAVGRPRKFCSDRCRRAHWDESRRNPTMFSRDRAS